FDPKMLAFLKRMPEFMGAITYSYTVEGIEATHEGKTQFALKNASFGVGAGQTKVRMTAGLGGMGMSAEAPMVPPEAEVQNAALEIDVSGVPGRQLWDIYVDALPAIQAEAKCVASTSTTTGTPESAAAASAEMEKLTGEMSMRFMQVLSSA